MRAVRFKDEDFQKPLVTMGAIWSNGLPCNGIHLRFHRLLIDHIRALGDLVMEQIEAEGGKSVAFGTPVMSDGITMGIEVDIFFIFLTYKSMKYSLPSRDLIADCIELMHEAYVSDGIITISGCDKRYFFPQKILKLKYSRSAHASRP